MHQLRVGYSRTVKLFSQFGKGRSVPAASTRESFASFAEKNEIADPLLSYATQLEGSGYRFSYWGEAHGLICEPDLDEASVVRQLQRARTRVEALFDESRGTKLRPILVAAFSTQEQLWTASEAIEGISHGPSQGRFLATPFPHLLVALVSARPERLLLHELTHAMYSGYGLPRWIDEGLALLAEARIFGVPEVARTRGVGRSPPLSSMSDFFEGTLFEDDDLEKRYAAYMFAFQVVRTVFEQDSKNFALQFKEYRSDIDHRIWLQHFFQMAVSAFAEQATKESGE